MQFRKCKYPAVKTDEQQFDCFEYVAFIYLNKLFMDFCCVCRTEVPSKDSGHSLPHSSLRAAAAVGTRPWRSSPLSHWTDYQIQFSLWPNRVITQPVFIWGKQYSIQSSKLQPRNVLGRICYSWKTNSSLVDRVEWWFIAFLHLNYLSFIG